MENAKYDLDELHQVQVQLLKKYISVCEESKLTYYLAFGSLLGAVRNHDIIAWDDSVDVVMPYEDYDKLISLPQDTWGEQLFLQTYYTDPQYPRCYAKLRDSRTTLIKTDYVDCDINQGIYINIMPLINLADQVSDRRKQINNAKLYKAVTENKTLRDMSMLLRVRAYLLSLSSARRKNAVREKLKEQVLKYEGQNTRECFALAGNISITLPLLKAWFSSQVEWDFGGMKVNIPAGWHEWLTLRYGDYMTAPISDLRGDKTAKFVTLNTRRPYAYYRGKTYCV